MSLKDLYQNSSAYTATPSKTQTTDTSTSKKKSSGLSSLLENSISEETKTPAPKTTPAPVIQGSAPTQVTTSTPATVAPKKSLFSKVADVYSKGVEKVTGRPDYEKKPASSSVFKNTLRELPSAITETILPGVGAIRDNQDLVSEYNIGAKDLAKELPGQVVEAGKQFIKAPISGALNLAMKPEKINVPYLGEVTNSQYEASKRIAEGQDPTVVALTEGGNAILNSLFFFGLASKAFTPRPSAISPKGEVTAPKNSGIPVDTGAKSFRLYEPPVITKPIEPSVLRKIATDNNIPLSTDYNPSNPTYFKMGGVKSNGKVTGQFFQLKPSYFDTFRTKLAGNPNNVPSNQVIPVLEVTKNVAEVKSTPTKFQEKYPAGSLSAKPEVRPETTPAVPSNLTKLAQDAGVLETTPTPEKPVISSNLPQNEQVTPPADQNTSNMVSNEVTPDVQTMINDGIPKEVATQAETDWQDNFAEKVSSIQENVAQIKDQLQQKGLSKTQKTDLQNQMTKLDNELGKIESDFVEKWQKQSVETKKPKEKALFTPRKQALQEKQKIATQLDLTKSVTPESITQTTAFAPERLKISGVTANEVSDLVNKAIRAGVDENLIRESFKYTATKLAIRDIKDAIVERGKKRIGMMDFHDSYTPNMRKLIREAQDSGDTFPYTKMTKEEQAIVDKTFRDALNEVIETPTKKVSETPEKKPVVKEAKSTGKKLFVKSAEAVKEKNSSTPGNTLKPIAEIQGKKVITPDQKVSKTQVRDLLKGIGKDNVDFKVVEIDGEKYMTYKDAKTDMKLRPSALGLVEDNIKVGDIINIDAKNLKPAGTAFRGYNAENGVEASLLSDLKESKLPPASTPEELAKRIEQLNKFGQARGILRRTGGLTKKQAGIFRHNRADVTDKGRVHLQDDIVKNPRAYMSVLAHELGHALEKSLTGNTNVDTYKIFGRDLTPEIKAKIKDELKAVTNDLEGVDKAKAGAGYYYKDTELLARFLQKHFESPGNLAELAPTAVEYFERSAVENPIVAEYLEAVRGQIDAGERKTIFARDMKQTYQKVLGSRVGEMAWNDEIRYRAMKERAKIEVEKLVKSKFKNVKDSPDLIFKTAEATKITKGGEPEFGTRDFQYAKDEKEAMRLMEAGYEPVRNDGKEKAFDLDSADGEWKVSGEYVYDIIDGKMQPRFAKTRYTEAEGKALYNQLSPEGKQLIKDFTSAKEEAKDYFNREVIKDVNKINSNIEGWVHHFWDEKGSFIGGKNLKTKVASAKKQRAGAEGYVEDLQKAMTKALTEIEDTKAYNAFIDEYFARVTKPIAKGEKPEPGWVEVVGDVRKGGIGTPQQMRGTVIQDGKSVPMQRPRYQMPADVYQRFNRIREMAVEASTATKVMNDINRYWRVNILFHPGSAMTNFISGGIQYSTKVLTDFYTELLTGSLKMEKTRRNIHAMLKVATPKGWEEAPDWVYGGDLSNYYGEFMTGKTPGIEALSKGVDIYADKALAFYGKVERYWKKVIATAEDVGDLKNLGKITKEGLRLPTDMEKQLLDDINSEIDLFAYDYDNVPVALQNFNQGFIGQAVKPFTKYPYKYAKHVTELATAIFDRTQPKEVRMAKLLALGTIMGAYAYYRSRKKKSQKTPEVPETAPPSVSTRGRLYVGTDSEGRELFTRTAKYPFVNLTETGAQFLEGNANTGFQSINDMVGSVAPVGKMALALLGFRNEYEQYTPYPTILGKDLSTFVPGSRILSDIARFFDPYQRKPETFSQGFTSLIPLPSASEDLRAKLRGDIRTIRIPLEGEIKPNAGEGTKRTTTDQYVKNFQTDILMGLLGGIYINRIDPETAKAFIIRKEKNEAKEAKKAEKTQTNSDGKPVSFLKKASDTAISLGKKALFLPEKAYAEEMPTKKYWIRDINVPVKENDLEEARAIIFGEVSNRSPEKQKLEAQTILNTAFNRMEEYNARKYKGRNDWSLTDVLQMPNQYQAYKENLYNRYKKGDISSLEKGKLEAIDEVLEKVRDGSFINNIGKDVFYVHLPDGRIRTSSKKLFR